MKEYENYLEYKTLGKLPRNIMSKYSTKQQVIESVCVNNIVIDVKKMQCKSCANVWFVEMHNRSKLKVCPYCGTELPVEEEKAKNSVVHKEPVRFPNPRKNEDIRWDEEKKELWVGESHTRITWDMIRPYRDDMEKLYVPRTVSEIDVNALNECTQLWAVCININNPYYSSRDGYDLYRKDSGERVWSIIDRRLPQKEPRYSKGYVVNAGTYKTSSWKLLQVSEECTDLTRKLLKPYMATVTHINLQKNVRNIDWNAIAECPNLKRIAVVYQNPYYKSRGRDIFQRGSEEPVWPKKK